MSEITEQVGQMIKEARKAQGLTQKELGKKLGISEGAVNRYESGSRNLSIEVLFKIANVLNLKLNLSMDRR